MKQLYKQFNKMKQERKEWEIKKYLGIRRKMYLINVFKNVSASLL